MVDEETLRAKFAESANVTQNGVTFGFTDEMLKAAEDDFVALFGGDFDTTSQTLAGRIIEAAMRAMLFTVANAAENAGQLNVGYATGRYLTSLGKLYDVERERKTRTSVKCVVGGVPGCVALPGMTVYDSHFKTLRTVSAVTIQPSGTAEVAAEYEDFEEGALPSPPSPGERLGIDEETVGIESVRVTEDTSDIVVGKPDESDDSLRKRVVSLRAAKENYLVEITNAVRSLRGVLSCFCCENGTFRHVFIDKNKKFRDAYTAGETIQVSAHSMICVVDLDTEIVGEGKEIPEDELRIKIADILYRNRSAGCGMTPMYRLESKSSADATDKVPVDAGKYASCVVVQPTNGYEIVFNKAEVVEFGIRISVKRNHYSGTASQLRDDIRSALNKWQYGLVEKVDGPSIGRAIYAYEIAAAISNVIPEMQVQSVKVGGGSDPDGWDQNVFGVLITQRAHCDIGSNVEISVA